MSALLPLRIDGLLMILLCAAGTMASLYVWTLASKRAVLRSDLEAIREVENSHSQDKEKARGNKEPT